MTTYFDNQLTFFDDQLPSQTSLSTASSVASTTGSVVDTVGIPQLILFVEKHQRRIWKNDKTRQNTVARIERFAGFDDYSSELTKPEQLSDITALHIYEWLDAEKGRCLTKEGDKGHPKYLSDTSINRYASAMSSVLQFACEARLINGVPKLRYAKEFARERYMTDQEVEQLIHHFLDQGDQWMADLCFVGVNTGMRLGEILSLGIVQCGKSSHWGEAQVLEDSVYLPGQITKTSEGRYVSINPDVRQACLRLTKSLGQCFTHRKFYDRWDDARAKIAPNDPNFVFHCLRHTCASRMANDLKIPTILIAEQLGHKSLQTTDRYVHSKPDAKSRFAREMSIGMEIMGKNSLAR